MIALAPLFIKLLKESMISQSRIPRLYENTYTDSVENFLLVYNPLSEKGLSVLNKEASFLFGLIDNKRTINDIFYLVKEKDISVEIADIVKVFDDFVSSEIAYFNTPKSETKLFSKKPTHLGVWLHITNQCNLRCTYCYVWKTQNKMSDETAQKSIKKIIESAEKHEFKKITFKFSGGESLLEFSKVLDLVRLGRKLAKKAKIEIDFVILTNGVLLTEEVAKKLKEENVRAAVSLDGLEKYNDRQRIFPNGLGTFKYVERGIQNIQKAKVPFNVSVTITSKNIENIPDLTKYLLECNIPFAFNFYRENPFVKEELAGDDKKLVEFLKKAYRLIYKNPPRYSLINGLLDRVTFKRPHLYTCGMGNSYIVVRQDGKMVSCQMTLEKPIGSIDAKDLIKTMREGNFVRPKNLSVEGKSPCNTCQWKYICCGGCPLLTFAQKGKYSVNSPYCAVYKALIPEVLRVEAKRLIKYGFKGTKTNKQELPSFLPLSS